MASLAADPRFASFQDEVLKGFFEKSRLAEENRDAENHAATLIQAHYRAYIVRKSLARLHRHAKVIQKHYRSRLAKKLHKKTLQKHVINLRVAYFNHMATTIQKHYRAYVSRKYKHDFYARKEYIREVTERSEEVVKEMRQSLRRQLEYEERERNNEIQRKFDGVFSKLHHLISTESCPSIFNSPYTALTGGPPTIAGHHVEDYLKLTKRGQLRDAPPLDDNSIQGLGKSFEESFAETKERFAGRTPVTYKPFISAGSTSVVTSEPTLRASTPYKSTAQREAQAKANAAKGNISQKPFVTAFKKGQLFEDSLFE